VLARIAALAAVLASAWSAGCTQARRVAAGPTVFVVAQTAEPRSLDPLLESGPTAEEIGSLVYSYLLRIGPRGELEPDLATQVPSLRNGGISADGRTIVYRLRAGVRWQDGQPFGAADVIATYRAIMDPRNAVPSRLGFDEVTSLTAPTPLTLCVHLRRRFAPFLTYFFEPENYPILPAHVLLRGGPLAGSVFDASPVGTGPFRVVAWHRGERLDLSANAQYYAGRPKMDRLHIEFVPSPQTIVERLLTGEADAYIAADPSVLTQLRSVRRLKVRISPIYGFLSLTFQTQDPALRDPRVRRRIAHLFDVSRDVRLASHGVLDARDAARGLFTWAYVPAAVPPSAAALPERLTLSFDGTRQLERTLALLMQQEARRAGMRLVLRPFSAQQFAATAVGQGPLASGNFQLALQEILTGADPETSWLLACNQIPSAGYNIARFCEPRVDRALADALRTNSRGRRARDYAIVQAAVARDVPFVALAQLREVDAVPAGMRGFQPSLETAFYRAERWELPAARR
jgi:peptide/nickel transport system substrate-binding protein